VKASTNIIFVSLEDPNHAGMPARPVSLTFSGSNLADHIQLTTRDSLCLNCGNLCSLRRPCLLALERESETCHRTIVAHELSKKPVLISSTFLRMIQIANVRDAATAAGGSSW